MSDVMKLGEVSKYLRLNRSTVYRLAQQGQIPATKIGRIWRFKREKIDKWFEEQEKKQNK